jgi:hypothetical protein
MNLSISAPGIAWIHLYVTESSRGPSPRPRAAYVLGTVAYKRPSEVSSMEELEIERASAFAVRIAWSEGFA